MSLDLPTRNTVCTRKPTFVNKPFTHAETLARSGAETYYRLARQYANRGDVLNALSCCIEASQQLIGITRPLAVRDQIVDLVRTIDPQDEIWSRIRRCITYAQPHAACSSAVSHGCTYLERLVSAHQLLDYPTTDSRFNAAYEHAHSQLRQNPELLELYVVQYTSGLCSSLNDLYFAVVPPTAISRRGPHYLTGICAAVRQ